MKSNLQSDCHGEYCTITPFHPLSFTQHNEFLSWNLPIRPDIMGIFMNACLAWDFDTGKFMAKFSPTLSSGTQCTYCSCRNTHWCQYHTICTHSGNQYFNMLAHTVAALVLKGVKPTWISLHVTMTHFSGIHWWCSVQVILGFYWDEHVHVHEQDF